MKAIYYLVTFVAASLVIAYAGWETYLHWPILVGPGMVHSQPADCMGCSCGCKESGVCDCAKKGIDCPCKCGCGTSGKCDCKQMKTTAPKK